MSSEARSRVELPWEWPDRFLSGAGLAAALAVVVVATWALLRAPETPDGFDTRWLVLIPLGFGLSVFGILRALARVPHVYNYPWAITDENAASQYRLARRFVLAFALMVALTFLHVAVAATLVPRSAGVARWAFAANLFALAVLIGGYIYLGWRRR